MFCPERVAVYLRREVEVAQGVGGRRWEEAKMMFKQGF